MCRVALRYGAVVGIRSALITSGLVERHRRYGTRSQHRRHKKGYRQQYNDALHTCFTSPPREGEARQTRRVDQRSQV